MNPYQIISLVLFVLFILLILWAGHLRRQRDEWCGDAKTKELIIASMNEVSNHNKAMIQKVVKANDTLAASNAKLAAENGACRKRIAEQDQEIVHLKAAAGKALVDAVMPKSAKQ